MSKFFGNDFSDTESSYYSTDSEDQKHGGPQPSSKYSVGYGDDSDPDDYLPKRVVVSGTDKQKNKWKVMSNSLFGSLRTLEWTSVSNEFGKMTRCLLPNPSIPYSLSDFEEDNPVLPEGFVPFLSAPVEFIKAIVDIEQVVKVQSEETRTGDSKSLSILKQRIKKISKNHVCDIHYYKEYFQQLDGVDLDTVSSSDSEMVSYRSGGESQPMVEKAEKWKKKAEPKPTSREPKVKTIRIRTEPRAGNLPKKEIETAPENVTKKFEEIISARGKKGTDKTDQISMLTRLAGCSETPEQRIRILCSLASSQFDMNGNQPVPSELWRQIEEEFRQVLRILETVPTKQLGSDDCDLAENLYSALAAGLARFDDEFSKSLTMLDPYSSEYTERLGNEVELYKLLVRTLNLVLETKLTALQGLLNEMMLRVLDHLYTKSDRVIEMFESVQRHALPSAPPISIRGLEEYFYLPSGKDISKGPRIVHYLGCFLYRHGNERQKLQARLSHVYHHAVNGRYGAAKALFISSNLRGIGHADVPLQILYNRTLLHFGLCAFRNAKFEESRLILKRLLSAERLRDFLGQSGTSGTDKHFKNVPLHLHANLELVELVYLVSWMLTRNEPLPKRTRFVAETVRECGIESTRLLTQGRWKQACQLVMAQELWNCWDPLDWPKFQAKFKYRSMFLFTTVNSKSFSSISLNYLGQVFELDLAEIHKTICKWILSEKMPSNAWLDEPAGDRQPNCVYLDTGSSAVDAVTEQLEKLDIRMLVSRV